MPSTQRTPLPYGPGDLLAGKYRIERILGVGGMGQVVAATHLHLDELVAIKFLLPHMLSNREAVKRFEREARAAVKIHNEHVARTIDIGYLPNGAPYIVMEYLDGVDLASRLLSNGPLPVDLAVEFVLQASEAVAYAHALGIVHRDLKPANLFVARAADGSELIKVLDFGISKLSSEVTRTESSITKTNAMMGSPLYMSPEQMTDSKSVDGRTDVWGLGTVLYEALRGAPPFLGDTMPEICAAVLSTTPRPLQAFRGDIPPALEAIIFRALEKDVGRRYANVAHFAAALAVFGSRRGRITAERIARVIRSSGLSSETVAVPASALPATEPVWAQDRRLPQAAEAPNGEPIAASAIPPGAPSGARGAGAAESAGPSFLGGPAGTNTGGASGLQVATNVRRSPPTGRGALLAVSLVLVASGFAGVMLWRLLSRLPSPTPAGAEAPLEAPRQLPEATPPKSEGTTPPKSEGKSAQGAAQASAPSSSDRRTPTAPRAATVSGRRTEAPGAGPRPPSSWRPPPRQTAASGRPSADPQARKPKDLFLDRN